MLVILTTHPIQYQVPLWQALARDGRVPFEVWYFTLHGTHLSRDREFGTSFAWDLDMLGGYPQRVLQVPRGATPNTFWKCRSRESIGKTLRKNNVKAIWIQGWQVVGYWQTVWTAKRVGVEVWLRAESNNLAPVPLWKCGIKRVLLGQLFQHIDYFLYIGSANRRLYESYAIPKERLFPAPYAVDNVRFAKQAKTIRGERSAAKGFGTARSQIRSQWKIPENAFCVLFCGKFIEKKRPLDLIKAAQLLISTGHLPNIHLLFVGSGELGAQLRLLSNIAFDANDTETTLNLRFRLAETKPSASFAGFLNQTEISNAYVAADCLVLPSDYRETWGLVVNEAMASGLPCIISDQCGCAGDLGAHGANLVFRCGDIQHLAKQLRSFASRKAAKGVISPPSLDETVTTVVSLYARQML